MDVAVGVFVAATVDVTVAAGVDVAGGVAEGETPGTVGVGPGVLVPFAGMVAVPVGSTGAVAT